MEKIEITNSFKRYLKNSALADKDRNLVEDYTSMDKWLNNNYDGTSTDGLLFLLKMDAAYRTITKASGRNVKFKEVAPFGTWDSMAVKKAAGYITNLRNAYSVGDFDAYTISTGQLKRLMSNLQEEGCDAVRLYIFQVFMQQDSDMMRVFRKAHKDVETILGLSTEEEIEKVLESIMYSNVKKSSSTVTETNVDSAPQLINEVAKRAYDAYQYCDIETIQQCIEDVTGLYAKGYFNRHGFSDEDAAHTYKCWVSVFKKYIMRIEV